MYAPTPNPFVDPLAYAMEGIDDNLTHLAGVRTDTCPRRWDEICFLAPQLRLIEQQVRATPKRQRDWRGWSAIKQRFSRYVGWESRDRRLSGSPAYDTVYSHLLAIWEGDS